MALARTGGCPEPLSFPGGEAATVDADLGPMRVIESLQDLIQATGIIGVMSSRQGSIANIEKGMREVYRGSNAALTMFMRSPGWVRTDLGGPDAPLAIQDSIPSLVSVMLAQKGTPGLRYLDRFGQTAPW